MAIYNNEDTDDSIYKYPNLSSFVSRFMYKEFDCYLVRVIVRVFGTLMCVGF